MCRVEEWYFLCFESDGSVLSTTEQIRLKRRFTLALGGWDIILSGEKDFVCVIPDFTFVCHRQGNTGMARSWRT